MRSSLFCFLLFLLPALTNSFAQTPAASVKSGHGHAMVTKQDDSRTLSETFQWIEQQMKFSGSSYDISRADKGYNWHRLTSYGNLQLRDCQMTIDKSSQSYGRQREIQYTIPLWDLSSATYQIDKGSKQFKYTPVVPGLFFRAHTKSMHWGRPRSYIATNLVEIEFGRDQNFSRDKINQLGGAFLHLRDLCASQRPHASADKSAKPMLKSVAPN